MGELFLVVELTAFPSSLNQVYDCKKNLEIIFIQVKFTLVVDVILRVIIFLRL